MPSLLVPCGRASRDIRARAAYQPAKTQAVQR
jgi:hypothetical protein